MFDSFSNCVGANEPDIHDIVPGKANRNRTPQVLLRFAHSRPQGRKATSQRHGSTESGPASGMDRPEAVGWQHDSKTKKPQPLSLLGFWIAHRPNCQLRLFCTGGREGHENSIHTYSGNACVDFIPCGYPGR